MKARRLAHFEPYLDQQIQELIKMVNINTPPGTIVLVPRTTPWPGWIKANGALLSRTGYADLWAEAQDSGLLVDEATWANNNLGCYSTGDGSTTFRIPDLRAEFFRAADDGRGVDSGRTVGSWQADAFQGHRHVFYRASSSGGAGETVVYSYTGPANTNMGNNTVREAVSDGVNGTPKIASETRSRNIALLACIKY